mmetsp:Transcript_2916/g.4502  ORF Transcript_2916/g.4502 Transcript_2916/m.4502 type:complete len:132 (+) Transcript_2916:275-670(+)
MSCKLLIMKTFLQLFELRRYDFTLNTEIPLVNPFTYFKTLDFEIFALNLNDFKNPTFLDLTYRCIEYLLILTQSNYSKADLIHFADLRSLKQFMEQDADDEAKGIQQQQDLIDKKYEQISDYHKRRRIKIS